MEEQHMDPEEVRNVANEVSNELLRRLTQPSSAAMPEAAFLRPGIPIGWDCTGSEFTCGEYVCSGTVGCSDVFKCTIKFTGVFARP
jgi:hypothetical protein